MWEDVGDGGGQVKEEGFCHISIRLVVVVYTYCNLKAILDFESQTEVHAGVSSFVLVIVL